MVSCVDCSCSNTPKNKSLGITFHSFPKDSEKNKLWKNFVNKPNWTPTRTSVLCSQHFTNECFDRTSMLKVRLHPNALPTIKVDRLKYVRTFNPLQLTSIESSEYQDEPLPGPSIKTETDLVINPCTDDTPHQIHLERKIMDLVKRDALRTIQIRKLHKIIWRQKKVINSLKTIVCLLKNKKLTDG
ncbi:THAP domain-containing protein 1-like [Diorhabda carinulata]|uniref:THAP domain-containing protein 1-like n=1 Tax=Diorhabda carinulata TaxID=1163345 RepID=UPI0025A21495|nr:THAP domain-containing protein 1-like [Diorhabda carinulata]